MGDHEVYERAVARDLDGLDREPLPITKKLREIIDENPNVRVTGILCRTAQCVDMWVWPCDEYASLAMRWSEEWNAWSCRPASGIYQQIIVFMPRDIDE